MALPAVLVVGNQSVTTTPTALTSTATLQSGLVVAAPLTNTGPIYVGPSGMSTSTSYVLNPGDTVSMSIASPNDVFVAVPSGAGAQNVTYVGS